MFKRSFWIYSVGLAVAWAIVLTIFFIARPEVAPRVLLVFGGFCIGWASTTIARYVYPPPKRWTRSSPGDPVGERQ